MKNIKYFLGGILTIVLFIPIIDKLLELIETWIDALKVTPNNKILNGEKEATFLREFLHPVRKVYDDEDFDEYEDDNYDE